ncbi:gluconokinase [Saccharicrinis aurantiacus]|uniref:gluconokinase n=1 Tax=Saccharicrinis aurantiacus TaxID=1849719 RepID=UPI001C9E3E64|nr:gluconokinase [Saccharicrinis aurantiacus]
MVIIMGVSGSGKTTIAQQLSKILNCPFYDADDFHPQSNKDKMANGNPLNDLDRLPWLQKLNEHIMHWSNNGQAILACSALKESYRSILEKGNKDIKWVVLNGDYEQLSSRLNERKGHFFEPKLLQSQLDTLEMPNYGIHVSINQSVEAIVQYVISKLKA